MIRKLFVLIVAFFILITNVGMSFAASLPQPAGYVNDFANLYSEEFRTTLEGNLKKFDEETGAQIAVVTIESLDGRDVETYAVDLFKSWGVGKKGKDTGLLLLIAKNERKIRIEVGYGLEPYITDGRAGEIIRRELAPDFKVEKYGDGTGKAIEKIQSIIRTQDLAPPESSETAPSGDFPFVPVLIFGYFLMTYIASFLGRTKEIWPGGAIGAVLGGIGGLLLFSFVLGIVGAVVFGLLGLLLDFFLSKNYQYRASHHLPTGFWGSRGGFSSGKTWGGGGGFGGFGGGRSGGGGASGGW